LTTPENIGSVYDLLAARLGVRGISVRPNFSASDLDIASKIIAENDPARVALLVVNLGSSVGYIRPLGVPTSTAGIRLGASGGSMSINWQDDMALPALEWQGIAEADNSALFVLELRLAP
jgi:hypothetical protein